MVNKGIILAGGKGTRLYPATEAVSKLLIPLFDKPVIYYPMTVLMMAGITDILIISSPDQISQFEDLLGDGSNIGITLSYEVQKKPEGIAQAFTIGADFIGKDRVALILGDNFFHGNQLSKMLLKATSMTNGAIIFSVSVDNPSEFGVVETDGNGRALSLEEKPKSPKSSNAVPGLYFYDNSVIDISTNLVKSDRGEYEITDVNLYYLNNRDLYVIESNEEMRWFDVGTHDALLEASNYVARCQKEYASLIGSIEATSYGIGLINTAQLYNLVESMPEGKYKLELAKLINQ